MNAPAHRAVHETSTLRAAGLLWLVAIVAVRFVAAGDPGSRGSAYIALSLVANLLMLVAFTRVRDRRDLRELVVVGIVGRLALFGTSAFLSHDATRYLWDGAATLAGFDPYVHSPRGIAAAMPAWSLPTDNAGYVTLYPPVALGLFVLAASTGPALAPFAWTAIATLASIATVLVAERAANDNGSPRHATFVALSPLLVIESAVGLHVDVVAALFVALGASAFARRRADVAAAFFALAALTKLSPALALIPLFFAAPRRMKPRMIASATIVFAVGYGLAFAASLRPLGSLGAFLSEWRFGSPVFAFLEGTLGTDRALVAGAALLIGTLAVASAIAALRDPLSGAFLALLAPFVASPVVFPWYLVAATPMLAHRRSAAFLAWSLSLPLTYEVLDRFDRTGEFTPERWPLVAIALACAAGVLVDLRTTRWSRAVRRDRRAY